MAISKLLKRWCMLFVAMCISATSVVQAQVLPILNSFSNRTFNGTVNVSWPVLFYGCTFVTDSIVLNHSYGAVFRNCKFESKTGVLYVAESGDGMILADCEVTGCEGLVMSRIFNPAYRNYITGVTVNSEECSVLDEQETIIDIDGLELTEKVLGRSDGPLFMVLSSDRKAPDDGEAVHLRIRGLEKGMFVGWHSSDSGLRLDVDDDGLGCRVFADNVKSTREAMICAYTEYGLEAAFMLQLTPETIETR